ncbi:MAG: EamA family transporter [Planctomycetales bacterium]|nr:EamA family transporter [Planctomycetales bacterium]
MQEEAYAPPLELANEPADGDESVANDFRNEPWSGRILIALAAVLWSTSGFFAKAPWFDAWPKEERGLMLAFYRSLFAMLILLPLIRKPVWRLSLLPMVFSFAVMVFTFMTAMVHGPAANAIWLQYLVPAWVLVAGVFWFGEKVTAADVRMIGACLGGVLLILAMEMWRGGNLYASAMGVLSGLSFAGVVLSMRTMRDVDPAWLITLNHLATVVILFPWTIQVQETVPTFGYIALGLFGVFQMSVPYILFARGLRTTSSPEASVLTLIEPLLVPIWVYIAWSSHPSYEAPHWWTWVGGSLILLGLMSRYLPQLLRPKLV